MSENVLDKIIKKVREKLNKPRWDEYLDYTFICAPCDITFTTKGYRPKCPACGKQALVHDIKDTRIEE